MTCQKVINGDENIMYLKDKLNESDIKLLENINIKISNRQYGCGEIYEMAENCVFNGEIFYMETDDDLSYEYMFLVDKLLAYGDNAYSGDEEGAWYNNFEELKEKIINQDMVVVNFKYKDKEYEIANMFDENKFFDIEQEEDEFIQAKYGYPVYRFINDKIEKTYYKTFEELLCNVKVEDNNIKDIFKDLIFY